MDFLRDHGLVRAHPPVRKRLAPNSHVRADRQRRRGDADELDPNSRSCPRLSAVRSGCREQARVRWPRVMAISPKGMAAITPTIPLPVPGPPLEVARCSAATAVPTRPTAMAPVRALPVLIRPATRARDSRSRRAASPPPCPRAVGGPPVDHRGRRGRRSGSAPPPRQCTGSAARARGPAGPRCRREPQGPRDHRRPGAVTMALLGRPARNGRSAPHSCHSD